jgi:hypothetical protein
MRQSFSLAQPCVHSQQWVLKSRPEHLQAVDQTKVMFILFNLHNHEAKVWSAAALCVQPAMSTEKQSTCRQQTKPKSHLFYLTYAAMGQSFGLVQPHVGNWQWVFQSMRLCLVKFMSATFTVTEVS